MEQSDFYLIHDLLAGKRGFQRIDMYIETPGGSGETAEEVVKFLSNNFDTISFVVSGEAKSAGTIKIDDLEEIEQKCPKCGEVCKIYAKFTPNPQIDVDFKNKGFIPFPKDAKIICKCGFEIDLSGIKNQIEMQTGREIIVK